MKGQQFLLKPTVLKVQKDLIKMCFAKYVDLYKEVHRSV